MKRTRIWTVLLLSAVVITMIIFGQSPQEQARIDFDTGRKALAAGQPDLALKKFESVIATLGSGPDIETFAAKAAFATKDMAAAQQHVKAAFAAADPEFKKTNAYQELVTMASDIELAAAKQAKTDSAKAAGYDPNDPLFGLVNWPARLDGLKKQYGNCHSDFLCMTPGAKLAWSYEEKNIKGPSYHHDVNVIYKKFIKRIGISGSDMIIDIIQGDKYLLTDRYLCGNSRLTVIQATSDGPGPQFLHFYEGESVPAAMAPGLSWVDSNYKWKFTVIGKEEVNIGGHKVTAWRADYHYRMPESGAHFDGRCWYMAGLGPVRCEGEETLRNLGILILRTQVAIELVSFQLPEQE